jgi:hypothetical protein
MFNRTTKIIVIILFTALCAGCYANDSKPKTTSLPTATSPNPILITRTITPTIPEPSTPVAEITKYAFPQSIDAESKYIFYLHGKIIEDQGVPAIDPIYGEYEYGAILDKFSENGFVVISEQRPKNADSMLYAKRIAEQVRDLLKADVPPENITIVGASKGAGIAILTSNILKNMEINFVILAICDPATVEELKKNQVVLFGNVLSIYDSKDELAGSCEGLFSFSKDQGLSKYNEIVLNVGTGHGIVYKPLDEWIVPVIQWAK